MGLRAWNAAVLVGAVAVWLATGTREPKPVFASSAQADAVRVLETDVARHPSDAAEVQKLAQAYLDNHAPGLAVTLIESSPAEVQAQPKVAHVLARALVEEGQNQEALAVEQRVLDTCGSLDDAAVAQGCDATLVVSATRRTEILRELVKLGVEDAQAQPEETRVAYRNATREANVQSQ
jgi:predicted Zn-dependent protease